MAISQGQKIIASDITDHINNKSNPHKVTAEQVGAAASSHNHAASNITSGTLPVARGGTGVTSLDALATALGGTKIQIGSYTGTGYYGDGNKNTLTFNFAPKVVQIFIGQELPRSDTYGHVFFACYIKGFSTMYNVTTNPDRTTNQQSNHKITVSASGNSISWFSTTSAQWQINRAGTIYWYVALG